ncbi:unnamed protein product [Closterium sp. Naga37s-1]|nr:unnamed protein product [Closterium sp. Naga37s-1]
MHSSCAALRRPSGARRQLPTLGGGLGGLGGTGGGGRFHSSPTPALPSLSPFPPLSDPLHTHPIPFLLFRSNGSADWLVGSVPPIQLPATKASPKAQAPSCVLDSEWLRAVQPDVVIESVVVTCGGISGSAPPASPGHPLYKPLFLLLHASHSLPTPPALPGALVSGHCGGRTALGLHQPANASPFITLSPGSPNCHSSPPTPPAPPGA